MPGDNSIEVEDAAGEKTTIAYDCLVIATGASKENPWRPDDDSMQTLEEREAEVTAFREKLKAAKSILCVGAGANGTETACYLKEFWPDKKVGICQRGKTMMPEVDGAHDVILKCLQELDVIYHSDTPFKEGEGIASEYEAIIDCRGFRYLGPRKYLQGEMSECIDGKTG